MASFASESAEITQAPETATGAGGAPKLRDAPLGFYLHDVIDALGDEIRAAREDRGRSFEVTDGHWLSGKDDAHLYAFRAEVALPIQAETPIRLAPKGGESVEGVLVALEDFEVIVQLRQYIGEAVDQARVSSEPWFIYEKLRGRLEDALEGEAGDVVLPESLLGLQAPVTGEEDPPAERGRALLQGLGRPGLAPNDAQFAAMRRCAGSRVHFVWGPPGTGKTASVAQVVRTVVAHGERVLVLAHANAAVDVAMVRIADAFSGTEELAAGRVLRIGAPQLPEAQGRTEILPDSILARKAPDLVKRKRALEAKREDLARSLRAPGPPDRRESIARQLEEVRQELGAIREALRQVLDGVLAHACILGATLSRMAIDDAVWTWPADTVVVDETSMAVVPAVVAAALKAKERLLLFGDFRQLPPISLARTPGARRWLGRDAFEVAGVRERIETEEQNAPVTLLDTQYRMAAPIASAVSDFAYLGRLRSSPDVLAAVRPLADLAPWPGAAVVVVDTRRLSPVCIKEPKLGSYSRANPLHAVLALAQAGRAASAGCNSVALVAPYRAQARLLSAGTRSLGATATAATVHRFQGSERDLVILDLVDAPPADGASQLTGKDPDTALRLLNVAVSRARGKLLVLADTSFVQRRHPRSSPARHLLRLLGREGRVEQPDVAFLNEQVRPSWVSWFNGWSDAEATLIQDLGATGRRLVMNLPIGFSPSSDVVRAVKVAAMRGAATTLFLPGDVAEHFEDVNADLRLMNRPGGLFALVDEHVAYVGGEQPEGAIARVQMPSLVEALDTLLLGGSLAMPAPRAEVEAALARVAGRCSDCGEDRRPRPGREGAWVLRCSDKGHGSAPVDHAALSAIADAMELRCPECGGRAVVRASGRRLFLGCPGYAHGCRGRVPSLEDLFGGA